MIMAVNVTTTDATDVAPPNVDGVLVSADDVVMVVAEVVPTPLVVRGAVGKSR